MHNNSVDYSRSRPLIRSASEGLAYHHDQFQQLAQLVETVYFVGPDHDTAHNAAEFLNQAGVRSITFTSPESYLSSDRWDSAACVVLDVTLSGGDGLDLQRRLTQGSHPPLVIVSNQCDIRSTVSAIKAGAIEVLLKPIDMPALLAAIRLAFSQDRRARQRRAELNLLKERYSSLTPREREVLPLVVGGLLNKQAAALLDISEVTLQIHRSQVMRKMKAGSLADLVRMAVKLRIQHWQDDQNVERDLHFIPSYAPMDKTQITKNSQTLRL